MYSRGFLPLVTDATRVTDHSSTVIDNVWGNIFVGASSTVISHKLAVTILVRHENIMFLPNPYVIQFIQQKATQIAQSVILEC